MRRSVTILSTLGLVCIIVVLGVSQSGQSGQSTVGQKRKNGESRDQLIGIQSVISVTDSGWSTPTNTSDCATGQADDTWELTLTEPRNLTVTVADCCCPGDYFEVRVDGNLIGTTPNLAPPWGCDVTGPLSSGSFTVPLCPGTHTITVRNAGFDGHSLTEIQAQGMCPAGFTVAGSLSAPSEVSSPVTPRISIQSSPSSPADDARQLEERIEALAPFVVTNSDGIQRLLSDEAQRAGVSGRALALGHQIIALNNRIVLAARRNEDLSLTRSDFKFIEPLFLQRAQQGHPCGDRQQPTACPDRVDSGQFFATEEAVRQHLISLGYHQTARYAGGGSGRDFTKVVDFPMCNGGPFRDQAIYFLQGSCWTYNTQGPEPNPEFLSYIGSWPYFSWPGYVRWWHLTFC